MQYKCSSLGLLQTWKLSVPPNPTRADTVRTGTSIQRPRAPPATFAKIHVDASLARPGIGGFASTVCRDSNGNYLGSSALVVEGVDDPASLEVMACREAMCLAEDLLINNYIVASDCKQVICDINSGSRGQYGAILSEINLRATLFQCIFSFE